jgi:hypothetical protein
MRTLTLPGDETTVRCGPKPLIALVQYPVSKGVALSQPGCLVPVRTHKILENRRINLDERRRVRGTHLIDLRVGWTDAHCVLKDSAKLTEFAWGIKSDGPDPHAVQWLLLFSCIIPACELLVSIP